MASTRIRADAAALSLALALGAAPSVWAQNAVPAGTGQGTAVAAGAEFGAAAQPAVRMDATAVALRAAAAETGDPAILAAYEAAGWAPLWLGDRPTRIAAGLLAAFDAAPTHALPPVAGVAALRAELDALSAAQEAGRNADPAAAMRLTAREAALDVALSLNVARYGARLAGGVLTPRKVDDEIHVDPPRPDPALMLTQIAAAPEPRRALEALAPSDPGYDALRARLASFRTLTAAGGWTARTPEGRTLRLGDQGRDVALLRARLVELGDARAPAPVKLAAAEPALTASASDAPAAAVIPARFDAELEAALQRFQRRHGLNADGVAGRRTFAALGAAADWRMRQIAVNLERMRWMNRDLGDRRIVVNQADFTMEVVLDGRVADRMRVVVGQARKHRTPEFSDEMTYMVVNPSWNVPYSIATKEILPQLRENPYYLQEQNMSLLTRGDNVPVDPLSLDWTQYSTGNFPFRIRQAPGEDNALGHVKFLFPNNFAIYLHDTPSRHLFAKDARAFSHGCVRVERPTDLAHLLLEGQVSDPAELYAGWLERDDEVWVTIRNPLQVHLTYRTAWVDPQTGEDQFRADVYGRDARIYAALEAAGAGL